MKGADDFCDVFPQSEQIGRLYILPSSHARGRTFRIYVLPENEKVIENGGINPPLNGDAVEVYGVISGQLGWTEVYGWLYKGRFIEDFSTILNKRVQLKQEGNLKRNAKIEKEKEREVNRKLDLLSTYN